MAPSPHNTITTPTAPTNPNTPQVPPPLPAAPLSTPFTSYPSLTTVPSGATNTASPSYSNLNSNMYLFPSPPTLTFLPPPP